MSKAETLQSGWRVLLIDASRNRFAKLLLSLEEAKIAIEHLSGTEENLVEKAVALRPNIVIVNLFLNGKSTLPVITRLKQLLKNYGTRIIVITAHNSINNIRESVKAGADDFVLEPIDPQLMMQRIRYQLQEREFYNPDELNQNQSSPSATQAGDSGGLQEGFQLVYDSLRILSEVTDHHEALTTVLGQVAKLASSNRVNLIEGDLETSQGLVAATSDDPTLKDLKIDLEKYPEVREVLLNSNIVYIKDITQNPLTKGIQEQVKSIKITSLLVFPIRHRSQTLGSLNVRLAGETTASDRFLKTFYMVALALGPKIAARKLLRRHNTKSTPKSGEGSDPSTPTSAE
ncbi:MAG: response regulator [Bdellovibrionota bacterium]